MNIFLKDSLFSENHVLKRNVMFGVVTLTIVFAYLTITLPIEYIAGSAMMMAEKHVEEAKNLMEGAHSGVLLSYLGFSLLMILRLFIAKEKTRCILAALLFGIVFVLSQLLPSIVPSLSSECALTFGLITIFLPYIATLPLKSKKAEGRISEIEKFNEMIEKATAIQQTLDDIQPNGQSDIIEHVDCGPVVIES